jgi:hypothetical protein
MRALLRRGGASVAANLLICALAFSFAVAAPRGAESPRMVMTSAASGGLTVSNSRDGEAILGAQGMRPGDRVTGTVRIGNASTLPAELSLSRAAEAETPGVGGALLSARLQLLVQDVTAGPAPLTVYNGQLTEMGLIPLGAFAPGESRDYLFAAFLPNGGAADDALQGARLSQGFVWRAVADEPPAIPTPAPPQPPVAAATPAPAAAPPASPAAPAPPTAAQVIGLPASRACLSRRRIVLHLHPPRALTIRRIDVRVTRTRARRYAGSRRRIAIDLRGMPRGKVRVRVTVRPTKGRALVLKRTYRTCAQRRRGRGKRSARSYRKPSPSSSSM